MPRILQPHGEPVRLGFLSGLTGPETILGETQRNCFKLAVDRINAGGSIARRPPEYIVKGDQTATRGAVDKPRKPVFDDRVDATTGLIASPQMLAGFGDDEFSLQPFGQGRRGKGFRHIDRSLCARPKAGHSGPAEFRTVADNQRAHRLVHRCLFHGDFLKIVVHRCSFMVNAGKPDDGQIKAKPHERGQCGFPGKRPVDAAHNAAQHENIDARPSTKDARGNKADSKDPERAFCGQRLGDGFDGRADIQEDRAALRHHFGGLCRDAPFGVGSKGALLGISKAGFGFAQADTAMKPKEKAILVQPDDVAPHALGGYAEVLCQGLDRGKTLLADDLHDPRLTFADLTLVPGFGFCWHAADSEYVR